MVEKSKTSDSLSLEIFNEKGQAHGPDRGAWGLPLRAYTILDSEPDVAAKSKVARAAGGVDTGQPTWRHLLLEGALAISKLDARVAVILPEGMGRSLSGRGRVATDAPDRDRRAASALDRVARCGDACNHHVRLLLALPGG